MKLINPNVYMLEGLRGGNVYLLGSKKSWILIDTGHRKDSFQILSQLNENGISHSKISAIVITHAHGDHTGGISALAEMIKAPIYAHSCEAAYLAREKSIPTESLSSKLIMWIGDRFLFNSPPVKVDRKLEDLDTIGSWDNIQVIHSPGHTPGSISVFQKEHRMLFCGDALFNANPITGKSGLHLPMKIVTSSSLKAVESVIKFSTLDVRALFCGHGEPILEDAGNKIQNLLNTNLSP